VIFRRRRFGDLIERQLAFFEDEHAELLRDLHKAETAYDRSGRDEAEERYGDYVDLVDAGRDALVEYRDAYAVTLEPEAAEEYEDVFGRLVRRRLPRFALELDYD
jgi:hypothetical protein